MSVELAERSVNRARTYNGGNGIVVLLCMLEESQDIIADDDAGLSGENVLNTHVDNC